MANDLVSAVGGVGLRLMLRLVIVSTRHCEADCQPRAPWPSAAATALTSGESHRTVPCFNPAQTARGAHNCFLRLKVKAVVVSLRH
jgi:hypothetical protein